MAVTVIKVKASKKFLEMMKEYEAERKARFQRYFEMIKNIEKK